MSPPATSCTPQLLLDQADITAGQVVTGHVNARPGDHVLVQAYSRPSTVYSVVRSAQVVPSSGVLDYTFRPSTNTRMFAASVECGGSPSVAVQVHGALGIAAQRTTTRTYTFTGTMFPAASYEGQAVRLYYVKGTTSVLKGIGRMRAGRAAITVTFTSSSRLTFYLAASANPTNGAARSRNRPTAIF